MIFWGETEQELFGLLKPIPKPCSDAELEIASAYFFGTPLHLKRLEVSRWRGKNSGSFEVAEDFDSYNTRPGEYDLDDVFWTWVVGERGTGGVARASYGQFRCGHRGCRRLERWICDRQAGDSSSVRPLFEKVSRAEKGLGENTLNRCRGVL